MGVAHARSTGRGRSGGAKGLAGLPVLAILAALLAQAETSEVAAAAPAPKALQTSGQLPQGQLQTPLAMPTAAQRMLDAQIDSLGRSFNGDIGIAVQDLQNGWTSDYDGATYFPQQSVSKFWVALTAFAAADRGELNMSAPVTVRREDMTLFHQPIAAKIGANGFSTTVGELIFRAMTQSDNTCNDFVLWKSGGPEAVRNFLRSRGIEGIRFGPGERLLQSRIAGMEWKQSYAYGGGFYAARNAVPATVRRAAFERYIKDPMDGATPLGVVDALGKLKRGELLSPASTQRLLSIMSNTRTGAQRLKGGLAPGWNLAHKTGTGQVLGGEQAGYNDIGIVTAPNGRSYAVAVLIRRTSAPLQQRMAAMQNTVRAVISYHNYQGGNDMAGRMSGAYGSR